MSNMSELSSMLDELITCGNTLTRTAQALKNHYTSTDDAAPAEAQEAPAEKEDAPANAYSKEEVRALLSGKASEADGRFKAAVKDIVKKYGNGGSLTNVDAKDYAALVAEVEALA